MPTESAVSTTTLLGVPYTSDGISVGAYSRRPLVTSDPNVLYLPFSVSLDGLDTSPDSACVFSLLQLTFFVILIFTSLERLRHVRGFDELLDWSFFGFLFRGCSPVLVLLCLLVFD